MRGRSLRFLIALVTFTWNFEKCLAAKRPQLAPLYSYVNTHSGPFRDHYATTWTPATYPEALSGYSLLDNFGLIGVEQSESEDEGKKAEECSCLQEIVQLFDQQVGLGATPQNPGLFGRVDHKFAKAGDEANMLFQKYERTGEKLFCATTMGECGATVPLYQWFVAPEVDTLYTTRDVNDAAVTNMVPQGILCYIWPGEMKDEDCAHQAATHQHQIDSGVISYGFNTEVTEDTKNVKGCDLNKLTTDHGQWATTRPDVTPGTVAVLNCDSGFVASQTPTIAVCQRSGDWMPPSGTCRMAGCEGPTNWKSEYGDITFSMEALRNPTDGSDLNIYPIGRCNAIWISAHSRPSISGTTAMLVCDKTSDVIEREADIVYCSESGWAPRMLGRCYKG
ncbi:hypothetical protein L596_002527 [Steinernema carpocapsae]|uniref:Sushi domain-containing protein n=1 Tax=Steinernema carpocapsae TaxID=34508 RepID=A0A4U8URC3_STECR|nr:hypothetical protein L596_002527 [Steinernema carpocapsae]